MTKITQYNYNILADYDNSYCFENWEINVDRLNIFAPLITKIHVGRYIHYDKHHDVILLVPYDDICIPILFSINCDVPKVVYL